jgi:transcriptional regulator
MYIPVDFQEENSEELLRFMQAHPLGTVVSATAAQEPCASHLPCLVKCIGNEWILEFHIAHANPQISFLKNGKTVLVIFNGPNAYVSSSVYTHANVPTWNYQSVHVHGFVEPMTDRELTEHLFASVAFFEAERPRKLDLNSLPPAMLKAYQQDISGFRIRAYKVEGAYKLSQNRNHADYGHIISDLASSSHRQEQEVAEAMEQLQQKRTGNA